jgi:putative oxidoreductase
VSSNPVFAFFSTPKSFGPFVLRMLLAAVFLYHGGQKMFGWFGGDGWTETLRTWSSPDGLGLPVALAATAVVGEVLVAVAMFFGFFTRLAALGVVAIMAGAIVLVHAGDGIAANEYPATLGMVAFALLFLGAGRLSLDRALSNQLLPGFG